MEKKLFLINELNFIKFGRVHSMMILLEWLDLLSKSRVMTNVLAVDFFNGEGGWLEIIESVDG